MLILDQKIMDYTYINIITRYPNWDENTTYMFDEILFYDHYYYKSVVDDNTGNIPPDSSAQWLRWDVSNRFAAIDLQAQTRTICDVNSKDNNDDDIPDGTPPYDLVMEFTTNNYDAIAFGGVDGDSITVEVFNENDLINPIQTITESLIIRSCVTGWWQYYNCPLASEITDFQRDFYYRIMPTKGIIRVTITENPYAESSSLAYMVSGNTYYVGDTLFNVGFGVEDFSVKETDDFGITTLLRRQSRQTRDVDVIFDSGRVNEVSRAVQNHLGIVVLFINDESEDSNYEHLLLLGYIEDFTTVLQNHIKTQCSFGLTEVI